MKKDVKLDGISFNAVFIRATFKTEADFLNYANDNKHWFADDQINRTAKLKQVYAMAFEGSVASEIPPPPFVAAATNTSGNAAANPVK